LPRKLTFACHIACGMNYLHSLQPPVIHSDLKSKNVVVSDKLVSKVSHYRVPLTEYADFFIIMMMMMIHLKLEWTVIYSLLLQY